MIMEIEPQATGAAFNRGRSNQDYQTPTEFINAVQRRFGRLDFDLAASPENAKAPCFFTEHDNSLVQDWTKLVGNIWLNPPFGDIAPWARKCRGSLGNRKIFFLTPASVGSNWFFDCVAGVAAVHFIAPRICFDGKNPFPKDCILSVFGLTAGYECWRWK